MKKVMVALIMTGGLLLVGAGCSKEEHKDADKGATGATGDKIGVQECDDYIAKYTACIAKMPAAAKSTAEQGFKTQKDAWRAAAATPQGKEGLKTGCKMALDSLAQNALCK
ncbi:MAG: hypothetical protein QM820_56830 [Minicystis sp.]